MAGSGTPPSRTGPHKADTQRAAEGGRNYTELGNGGP